MKKAITIKDIAEQLGLSRNTVAKALNGQYVPPKTREIVIHKAKELNYKSVNIEKNEIAKDKKSKKSKDVSAHSCSFGDLPDTFVWDDGCLGVQPGSRDQPEA